ncbi:MAG: hypothetical protein ACREJQ_04210 [bacterium]
MKLQKLTPGRIALWLTAILLLSAGLAAITGWANSPLWLLLYPLLIIPLLGLMILAVFYLFQRF